MKRGGIVIVLVYRVVRVTGLQELRLQEFM